MLSVEEKGWLYVCKMKSRILIHLMFHIAILFCMQQEMHCKLIVSILLYAYRTQYFKSGKTLLL